MQCLSKPIRLHKPFPLGFRMIRKTSLFNQTSKDLILAGNFFHSKGWAPATSGNYSAKVNDKIAITASGCHKGELTTDDIIIIDNKANILETAKANQRSSAETLIHTLLYNTYPEIGSVLHVHSMHSTIISQLFPTYVELKGYELLKALPDVSTHDTTIQIPIVENDQNMVRLAAEIEKKLEITPHPWGLLIRNHGLYAWGKSILATRYLVEAFDFLFETELRLQTVRQQ